jgi:drug/metabolite transporter (DMT)-like permease
MSAPHNRLEEITVAVAPALFVLLWSTGFIGAKYGLPYAEPLTFLYVRFLAALVVVVLIAWVTSAPVPDRAGIFHTVVTGLLMQGIYLGGVFISIHRGMPAGISALIVGLQPLLTSTIANRLLGEKVLPLQWIGLMLGLAGLVLVVQDRTGTGEAALFAWITSIAALIGITLGTLYQKQYAGHVDLRSSLVVQYAAAAAFCGIGAGLFETGKVQWTGEFIFAVAWLVFVLSCGAIFLLMFMIRRSAATKVASLFYLVPPVTALMAWGMFGERLSPLALMGMLVSVGGVFLVNRAPPQKT